MAETHRPWMGVGRIHGVKRKVLYIFTWVSLMAQLVKNPPAMQETWVQSLGWEEPLKKVKVTHSIILAWRIPWTVWSMGSQRDGHN